MPEVSTFRNEYHPVMDTVRQKWYFEHFVVYFIICIKIQVVRTIRIILSILLFISGRIWTNKNFTAQQVSEDVEYFEKSTAQYAPKYFHL